MGRGGPQKVREPECGIYSVVRYQPLIGNRIRLKSLKNSWLHKQPNSPRTLRDDPKEEMRRMLKYYPKKFSSLKEITLAYQSHEILYHELDDKTKELYRKIISKYKKDFFRYFCLNLQQKKICPSSSLFLRSFHSVRTLYIYSSKKPIQSYEHFPHIVKHNKLLSHLQINTCDNEEEDESFRLKWLRHLPNLKRLQMHRIPAEKSNDWKRSLSNVEILTVFDTVDEDNLEQFVKGIKTISQLNSLKKVNFEFSILENRVLERIPFEDFKARNIAYDFRIAISDEEPGKVSFSGLAQADFLGMSCLRDDVLATLHDPFQLSSVDLQRQAKNRFFLQGADQRSFDSLLKNCQSIVTLDLVLSGDEEYRRSLPSLHHLVNLRNLSLRIFEYDKSFDKEWKILTDFAQENKNITYLSLDIKSGYLPKRNSKHIEPFFDALKDSLTTLLLSFKETDVEEEALESLSTKISNIQKLKFLYLDNIFLIESLKSSMPCDLEELKLQLSEEATSKLLEPTLKGTSKLVKLFLEVKSFEKSFNFSKVFSSLTELREFELIINAFPKKNFNALVKGLSKLTNLEILKVAGQDKFSLIDVGEAEIQKVRQNLPNLKLIALGHPYHPYKALSVAVKKGYLYNIETFLCRFNQGELDTIDYRIFYF